MEKTIRKTFLKSDGTRKVVLCEREDETFGFEELKFSSEENCWFVTGKYSVAIIDSLGSAVREARSRVGWLSNLDVQ